MDQSHQEQEFESYEEYRKHILKCLDVISRECLNLEILTAQIKDDSAARGAMAAVDFMRKDTEKVISLIKIGYKGHK